MTTEKYICLDKEEFLFEDYKLVPIRYQDRFDIMNWRNEQMFHLRQADKLTKESQEQYFENVVSKLFSKKQPNQILFSLLKNNICIGYGGLVHINWIDKNAEISFIMDSKLEGKYFGKTWSIYLKLLDEIAFKHLKLHKINTFAFDLRPHLYGILESCFYQKEAVLKEHCLFHGKFIDVVIHSKINK